MTTLRLALAGLLVALGLVVVVDAPAQACTCLIGTPQQRLDRADAVFTGTLTGVGLPPPGDVVASVDPVTYRFDVATVYAGEVDATTVITSPRLGASCGLERMRVGTDYLVFATLQRGVLTSWLCSGTEPVRRAPVDRVAELTGVAGPERYVWPVPPDWWSILAF